MKFLHKFIIFITSIVGLIAGGMWLAQTISMLNKTNWDVKNNFETFIAFLVSLLAIMLIILVFIFLWKKPLIGIIGTYIIILACFVLLFGSTIQAGLWLTNHNQWTVYNKTDSLAEICIFSIGTGLIVLNSTLTILRIIKH